MKKGFFFSLGAFFAIMIFTLVLVSIYGYFVNTQELRQQYYFSEDLLDIFTSVRMEEIKDNYQDIEDLYISEFPEVRNNMSLDITIMDQVIVLNTGTENSLNAAKVIITSLTGSLLGERYGLSFDIDNNLVYGRDKEINALVSRQRFVSG
jgi:hypothetical protein